MKVLILGHKGMLGSMVYKYFKHQNTNCEAIEDRWPSESFNDKISSFDGDYIINCIGAIPQKTKSFMINYELPQKLERLAKENVKIIHPGSDCEMEEDPYGISKKKASDWIKDYSRRTKIIKASIIGPELDSADNLMSWFLSQDPSIPISGYSKCMWNGITTLEWAKYCYWGHCFGWEKTPQEQILKTYNISKYELLMIMNKVFQKDIKITPVEEPVIDRCLEGGLLTYDINSQLVDLKIFCGDLSNENN